MSWSISFCPPPRSQTVSFEAMKRRWAMESTPRGEWCASRVDACLKRAGKSFWACTFHANFCLSTIKNGAGGNAHLAISNPSAIRLSFMARRDGWVLARIALVIQPFDFIAMIARMDSLLKYLLNVSSGRSALPSSQCLGSDESLAINPQLELHHVS